MNGDDASTIRFGWPLRRPAMAGIAVVMLLAMAAPLAVAQQGVWSAEFFANPTLSGSPVFTRTDGAIDFNWGSGAPAAGVPADGFSVRWTRTDWLESGNYEFSARSDDGIRVWVGSTLVIDSWVDQQGGWITRDIYLAQGNYQIRVEYYENQGGAMVFLDWNPGTGGSGWKAKYYAAKEPGGTPVLTRTDSAIDFNWKEGSPTSALPVDRFSVRWTQTLGFSAGNYRFLASADDGVRIWVDGSLVVDAWRNQALPNTTTGDRQLTEGMHDVKVEYFEDGGVAEVHVWWQRLDTGTAGWRGEYYSNRDLVGGPALTRDDAAVDFDWGTGSPVSWMPGDNFSVRWTRQMTFDAGYYRVSVQADDGVRVWLNNGLVIDKWQQQANQLHYVDGIYLAGVNQLKVEYFEQTGYARIKLWFTPSGTPSPAPTTGPWRGEYYSNATLSGSAALVRSEEKVDYDWAWGSPAAGSIGSDQFSARWTRTVNLPAGTYRFTMTVDDGGRLWVRDQLLIDAWRVQAVQAYTADVAVPGGDVAIKMEYYENTGLAVARLNWALTSATVAPPPPPPVGGVVVLEDNAPGFVKGGSASAWRTVAQGSGGSMVWTYNNDYARSNYNWARWYPDLNPGRYEVFVYIPAANSTTTNARYWLRHADGYTLQRVDQSANQGRWISLGTYRFGGTDTDYVSLADITYEQHLSKMIAFDAIKWEPR